MRPHGRQIPRLWTLHRGVDGDRPAWDVTISGVTPAPPSCVLRFSSNPSERLLELTSSNFSTTYHNLQFRKAATGEQPLTYQDLMPRFLRELHQAGYEMLPELRDILEENFLQDEADRWYVPDPGHSQDLEKLRERALLREFREYVAGRGRLKVFRSEAVRAGFRDAWRRRDYAVIVAVAQRLPERIVQEDADLLMYYDNALMRSETA